MIKVVEPGALQGAFRHVKARRTYDINANIEAGAGPQKRAGVLRDVRLVKRETDHLAPAWLLSLRGPQSGLQDTHGNIVAGMRQFAHNMGYTAALRIDVGNARQHGEKCYCDDALLRTSNETALSAPRDGRSPGG